MYKRAHVGYIIIYYSPPQRDQTYILVCSIGYKVPYIYTYKAQLLAAKIEPWGSYKPNSRAESCSGSKQKNIYIMYYCRWFIVIYHRFRYTVYQKVWYYM